MSEVSFVPVTDVPADGRVGREAGPLSQEYLTALARGEALVVPVADYKAFLKLATRFRALARQRGYTGRTRWQSATSTGYFWGERHVAG